MADVDADIQGDELRELIDSLFNNVEEDGEPPWWSKVIRSLVCQVDELEKDAGVAEPLNDDVLRVTYDQRDVMERGSVKWYNPNTDVGDRRGSSRRTLKKGLCAHHTAVKGGFGAHKRIVRGYQDMTPEELRGKYGPRLKDFHGDDDVTNLTHDQIARLLALADRFRGHPKGKYNGGVPYQAITGANSVLYLNLPFDWVTWASNGANNDFLAYGWDAHSMHDLIDGKDCSEDMIHVIELARAEGHPIEELTCHCAWTNKPRDPGKDFIEQVMVPVAEATGCVINWDFKAKKSAKSLGEVVGRAA